MPKEEQNFGFPEKYNKHLKASSFKEDANTMSEEELNKAIITCENGISQIEKAKEEDEQLTAAKEIVKDLNGGYRDAIMFETAKIKYSLYMLESRGKL